MMKKAFVLWMIAALIAAMLPAESLAENDFELDIPLELLGGQETGISSGENEADEDDHDDQDAYWTESGREALWNALNTGNPKPLSADQKSAFFRQYAVDMVLFENAALAEETGHFSIRRDGSFHADYKYSSPYFDENDINEADGDGTIVNVYQLSDWVYALEPGNIRWKVQENEFVVQNYMLFEIPGATQNDPGILKYELQSIAEKNGVDPASPVPFCFITAFDSGCLWFGKPGESVSGTAASSSASQQRVMKTAKANTNVRKAANKSSGKIVTLEKKGTEVTILEETRDDSGQVWYYIQTPKGKKGYIRSDLLEP